MHTVHKFSNMQILWVIISVLVFFKIYYSIFCIESHRILLFFEPALHGLRSLLLL